MPSLYKIAENLKSFLSENFVRPIKTVGRRLDLVYVVNKGQTKFDCMDTGALTQNVWVTVFDRYNVAVRAGSFKITVADEDLDVRIYVNDQLIDNDGDRSLVAAGNHSCNISHTMYSNYGGSTFYFALGAAGTSTLINAYPLEWLRGHVVIEVRKVTAGGASHCLSVVCYEE